MLHAQGTGLGFPARLPVEHWVVEAHGNVTRIAWGRRQRASFSPCQSVSFKDIRRGDEIADGWNFPP